MRRKHKIKKALVTISAVKPTQHCENFTVRQFYYLPVEYADQQHVDGFRLRMARALDIDPAQIEGKVGKPRRSYRWHPDRWRDHSDEGWLDKALAYVHWLAKRDGVTLPEITSYHRVKVKAIWSYVFSKAVKGPQGQPVRERRIMAVAWGHEEKVYYQRKDGKRGAHLGTEFVEEYRFPLPNWDFNPDGPVETMEEGPAAIAA